MRGLRIASSRRWLQLALLTALALAVAGATITSSPASADTVPNLVANGGFEQPDATPNAFDTFNAPSTGLTDWTIESGSIDRINDYWPAHEGARSIDLDGSNGNGPGQSPGTISQLLTTIPGKSYDLSFYYSANPDVCGPTIPSMDVSWGNGLVSGSPFAHARPTWIIQGSSANMNWTQGHATVTATGSSTKLTFHSTSASGQCGIALDDVSVTAVPTPPPPAPNAPVLFGAVPPSGGAESSVAGLVQGASSLPKNTPFQVSFFSGPACDTATAPLGSPATVTTGDNANGVAGFALAFPGLTQGTYVRAKAAGIVDVDVVGDLSGFSNCVRVEPNNTSWQDALQLPSGSSSSTSYLQTQGEARWFKLPILPNGKVDISLLNLPADYDLVVFGDIQAAYDALAAGATAPGGGPGLSQDDLTKQATGASGDAFNTTQYNPSSWDPTNWDPSLDSAGFSASQWSASQWSASQWSASQWSASQWSASQWSASQWSASQWSASQWSASQWSASQWSASQWSASQWSGTDPKLYTGAQTASLISISAQPGTGAESASVNTWNNTGFVYIRVQGKNGSFDPTKSFTLNANFTGQLCAGVTAPAADTAPPTPIAGDYDTVILTDSSRIALGNAQTAGTPANKLANFATRTEVNGVVVDVNTDAVVQTLNAQAEDHRGCPYAKNLVASRIKQIVDTYRPIKYVVVVGGDSVIPFFRYPDPALLGNETMYSPPVKDDSASQASLRLGYVLNQDGYGSTDDLLLHGNAFPVPDLPVGRLVETPTEIGGMLDAYTGLTNGVVPTPTSSLVTGYDFLQDAADAVAGNLRDSIGGASNATLITNQGISPSVVTVNNTPDRNHSWTADDLRTSLFNSGRHDLVFLAGHFSANDALAADYKTNILSTELSSAPATLFKNAIVFSAGCHAGYNIVDGDAIQNVTQPLDWVQAFAQKQATLIAGTGYQYGDTDMLAYSERIYAEFTRQLRISPGATLVPVSVGDALVRSKRNYLKTTAAPLSGLDEKALLEATLFGLPMLSVNFQQNRLSSGTDSSVVDALGAPSGGPGAFLGLRTTDLDVPIPGSDLVATTKQLKNTDGSDGPTATYLTGPDGVVVKPTQPILPLVSRNVTSPETGLVLSGVGFRAGSYNDALGVTPLTAAPATELRGVHAPFFTDVLFPTQPYSANYLDAFGAGAGSPVAGGATRLMVTPVQHISDSDPTLSTRRTFSDLNFRLYYSGNTSSYCFGGLTLTPGSPPCLPGATLTFPALAAPPTIAGIDTSYDASTRTLSFKAHVIGDPVAGIQEAWVTWTIPSGAGGVWQSRDLVQDGADASLWTGSMVLPDGVNDPGVVRFMVQAASGIGRVMLDNNNGAFYRPGSIPGATPPTPPADTSLALGPTPASVKYGAQFPVTVALKQGSTPLGGKLVRIGLGAAVLPAFTDANGTATVTLRAGVTPGNYPVTATFAGDVGLGSATAGGVVQVQVMGTSLTLTGGGTKLRTDPLWLSASLVDAGSPAAALAQRAVYFILTNTSTSAKQGITATTDPSGRVSIGNLASVPVGAYSVKAYFNGAPAPFGLAPDDVDYAPATAGPLTLTLTDPCGSPRPTGAIVGSSGNDTINGTSGNDVIYGLGGNDKINGKGGNDVVCTLTGNDTITTGEGNDIVIDTGGTNSITTGGGKDQITTGSGADTINSGEGDDVVKDAGGTNSITTGGGADQITTGSGADTINSGEGNDTVSDAGGTNSVTTGGGADQITTASGTDTINSGEGDDVVKDAGGTNSITTGGGADQITTGSGADTINSGEGNDTVSDAGGTNSVTTAGGNDTVTTGSGNDTISGGGGDDTINAGDGANTVNGNDGNDRITTGSGNDKIDGGAGIDSYRPGSGSNTVTNCEILF